MVGIWNGGVSENIKNFHCGDSEHVVFSMVIVRMLSTSMVVTMGMISISIFHVGDSVQYLWERGRGHGGGRGALCRDLETYRMYPWSAATLKSHPSS